MPENDARQAKRQHRIDMTRINTKSYLRLNLGIVPVNCSREMDQLIFNAF